MSRTEPRREYRFSFHGLALRYLASSSRLLASVAPWTRYFHQDDRAGGDGLTIHFEEVAHRDAVPLSWQASARQLFSGTRPAIGSSMRALWHCDVLQDGGRLIVDVRNQGVLVIDGCRGTAHGFFFNTDTMHEDRLEIFFHVALAELLKRCGMYTLHATALEYHGRGVLVGGRSGSGKTTALLSLLRAGYRYLSDEHPLLWDSQAGLKVLAAPMKVDVSDQTIAFFPELRDALTGSLRQGVCKKSFHVEDVYDHAPGRSCEPAMILFPHVTKMAHSCLEPLSKSQALGFLMPDAPLVYDDELAKREFHALSKLVQQTACYRLHFGEDVLDLPKLITPLLERH